MATSSTQAFEDEPARREAEALFVDAVGGSGISDEHVRRLESAGRRLAKFKHAERGIRSRS